jgi:hypothetical protein
MQYTIISNELEMSRLRHDVAEAVIKNSQEILESQDINFTEKMSKSLRVVDNSGETQIISDSPYIKPVEWGMPAGKSVNFDALRYWVEEKLGISVEESTNVTFKIYKKIKNEGIAPTRFFKKALIKIGARGRGVGGTSSSRKPRKKTSKLLKIIKKLTNTINSINKTYKRVKGMIK